jgi:hypothetical protein
LNQDIPRILQRIGLLQVTPAAIDHAVTTFVLHSDVVQAVHVHQVVLITEPQQAGRELMYLLVDRILDDVYMKNQANR